MKNDDNDDDDIVHSWMVHVHICSLSFAVSIQTPQSLIYTPSFLSPACCC